MCGLLHGQHMVYTDPPIPVDSYTVERLPNRTATLTLLLTLTRLVKIVF